MGETQHGIHMIPSDHPPPEDFKMDRMLYMLRHRYRYLQERVTAQRAAYLAHEHTLYFWGWIDAALELQALKEYASRYKATGFLQ
jgi:hypothetical protein